MSAESEVKIVLRYEDARPGWQTASERSDWKLDLFDIVRLWDCENVRSETFQLHHSEYASL